MKKTIFLGLAAGVFFVASMLLFFYRTGLESWAFVCMAAAATVSWSAFKGRLSVASASFALPLVLLVGFAEMLFPNMEPRDTNISTAIGFVVITAISFVVASIIHFIARIVRHAMQARAQKAVKHDPVFETYRHRQFSECPAFLADPESGSHVPAA